MSSVRMHACGMMNRSALEFVRSRSCHSGTFSRAGCTNPRTILASPQMFSDVIGFLFCAIVELPICLAPKDSSTSLISVRWRFLTSVANFSIEADIPARTETNSA